MRATRDDTRPVRAERRTNRGMMTAVRNVLHDASRTSDDARDHGRTLGVLVVYSPRYAVRATKEFARLMRQIDRSATIRVVNNNASLTLDGLPEVVVSGSNTMGEFSGWDEGVADVGWDEREGVDRYVFANDTFPFHRRWSAIERIAFVRAVRRADPETPCMYGDVDATRKPFAIAGRTGTTWVSTYLFALTHAAFVAIGGRIGSDEALLDAWVPDHTADAALAPLLSDALDPALREHVEGWLHGTSRDGPAWRAAEPLRPDNREAFRCKARAILSEKHLSARLVSAGGRLERLLPSPPKRVLHRALGVVQRTGGSG